MSSLGGDEGSRVLSKDMDIWVGAQNDSDSPAGLEDELFAVPHDAEGTRALLQALVPGRPLPAEVDVRCSSGDEQRFRDGCFLLVKMAHDWPLRLLVKPLAADAGDVELGEGVLLVGVGVGTDEPFGPAVDVILDVDKVRAMSGGLTTWVGTVNANHALAADLAADPELEPHLTTPATSAAAKVAIHALARGLELPLGSCGGATIPLTKASATGPSTLSSGCSEKGCACRSSLSAPDRDGCRRPGTRSLSTSAQARSTPSGTDLTTV